MVKETKTAKYLFRNLGIFP